MPLCYTKVATFHVTHRKSDTSIIARIGNFHITSKKGDTFYSVRRKIDPFHITSWFVLLFTPRKRLMFLAFTWKLPTHSTLVWENCKRNCASPDNSQSLTNACFPWIKKCAAKVFFFHLIDGNWRQFFIWLTAIFHLIDGNFSSDWRQFFIWLTANFFSSDWRQFFFHLIDGNFFFIWLTAIFFSSDWRQWSLFFVGVVKVIVLALNRD